MAALRVSFLEPRPSRCAEHRSVDDQAEWLDDDHVLYALPGSDGDPRLYDVWSVPTDGSGKPRRTIRLASSPAVVK